MDINKGGIFCEIPQHDDYDIQLVYMDYQKEMCFRMCKMCKRAQNQLQQQFFQNEQNSFQKDLEKIPNWKNDIQIKQQMENMFLELKQKLYKIENKLLDQFNSTCDTLIHQNNKEFSIQKIQQMIDQVFKENILIKQESEKAIYEFITKFSELFFQSLKLQQTSQQKLELIIKNRDTLTLLRKYQSTYTLDSKYLKQNQIIEEKKQLKYILNQNYKQSKLIVNEYQNQIENITKQLKSFQDKIEEEKKFVIENQKSLKDQIEKLNEINEEEFEKCEIIIETQQFISNIKHTIDYFQIKKQIHYDFPFIQLHFKKEDLISDIQIEIPNQQQQKEIIQYIGQFNSKGERHGYGIGIYENQTNFIGQWFNNQPEQKQQSYILSTDKRVQKQQTRDISPLTPYNDFMDNNIDEPIINLDDQEIELIQNLSGTHPQNLNTLFRIDLSKKYDNDQFKIKLLKIDGQIILQSQLWKAILKQINQVILLDIKFYSTKQNQYEQYNNIELNQNGTINENRIINNNNELLSKMICEKYEYEGGFNNKLEFQGKGELKKNFKNDIKNCQNISQIVYDGQFINGLYNGIGKQYLQNNYIYEGSFRNNKKHGSGKIYKNKAFIKDAMFYEDQNINDLQWKI